MGINCADTGSTTIHIPIAATRNTFLDSASNRPSMVDGSVFDDIAIGSSRMAAASRHSFNVE